MELTFQFLKPSLLRPGQNDQSRAPFLTWPKNMHLSRLRRH